ncbi:hypothetical protein NQ317_011236 [Molorchus minor]|uniref:DUF7041 domain-containing protein n=1 Tax=Molorchus minor TaxID=1323400 RepID=A0ABQ9J9Q2_9CUCU|nr:hypothetical protein NQ317_011236 [Molorchus minor]
MPNTPVAEGTPVTMDNEVHRVSLRVPPFWSEKVALWFLQLEAQFLVAGIKQDSTKFGPPRQSTNGGIIRLEGKYEAIKGELIKRLSDSSSQRLRKLLESEELGLAEKNVPDEFIKTLWMNRLSTSTQRVFAVSTELPLTHLAELADRVEPRD